MEARVSPVSLESTRPRLEVCRVQTARLASIRRSQAQLRRQCVDVYQDMQAIRIHVMHAAGANTLWAVQLHSAQIV